MTDVPDWLCALMMLLSFGWGLLTMYRVYNELHPFWSGFAEVLTPWRWRRR